MTTKEITFNTIEDVKQFVNRVEQYPQDVDVCCGSCMVDGKSILGILRGAQVCDLPAQKPYPPPVPSHSLHGLASILSAN